MPVESRRVSDHYRSTSSSYPTQGIRTPEVGNSPPATVRGRKFFSIGRYSKSNHRLSQLFSSSASSTRAQLDSTEGYRQPLDAVVVDDKSESLTSTITNETKPVESGTDDLTAAEWKSMPPLTDDICVDIGETAVVQPVQDPIRANPEATNSTDTIVMSSSDLIDTPPASLDEKVYEIVNGTIKKSEATKVVLPPDVVTDEPMDVDSVPQSIIPSKCNLERLTDGSHSWADTADGHRVLITSRTSTQQNKQLSGPGAGDEPSLGTERKPTAAVRLGRRVCKVRFAKWLTNRLRRVRRRNRHGRKPALAGQELTQANLRRIERADRVAHGKIRKRKYNRTLKARRVGLLSMRGDMEGKGADAADEKDTPMVDADAVGEKTDRETDVVLVLPNGEVSVPGAETTTPPTIGRRAAAWFKEQTGSVRDSLDLTRFLLGEMKLEMKPAA